MPEIYIPNTVLFYLCGERWRRGGREWLGTEGFTTRSGAICGEIRQPTVRQLLRMPLGGNLKLGETLAAQQQPTKKKNVQESAEHQRCVVNKAIIESFRAAEKKTATNSVQFSSILLRLHTQTRRRRRRHRIVPCDFPYHRASNKNVVSLPVVETNEPDQSADRETTDRSGWHQRAKQYDTRTHTRTNHRR